MLQRIIYGVIGTIIAYVFILAIRHIFVVLSIFFIAMLSYLIYSYLFDYQTFSTTGNIATKLFQGVGILLWDIPIYWVIVPFYEGITHNIWTFLFFIVSFITLIYFIISEGSIISTALSIACYIAIMLFVFFLASVPSSIILSIIGGIIISAIVVASCLFAVFKALS